jgi:hypothetical protein
MFANPLTEKLACFVREIGIDVRKGAIPDKTFLSGLDIQHGAIVVDEQRLSHPGDILHEAGHIAVSDPAVRNAATLSPTHGAEIATLAWSYAVLCHLDPAVVFHPDGHKGGSRSLIDNFTAGHTIGVTLRQYFGSRSNRNSPLSATLNLSPQMLRWIR